jgi:uncharacterized lipoprotein YddW (UPF0748 family)
MKNIFVIVCFVILFFSNLISQELRGVWVARDILTSKATIAQVMDSIANNNFNVVYFNVWSRGYPLWKSDLFYKETGVYTDPLYQNRDLLAEAITEAHRRGLEIEAWFEYGFVAWWSGNNLTDYPKGQLLAKHPDWVNKNSSGVEEFPSGSSGNFYWMSHTKPEVHEFLIGLCKEIIEKYDIDGIELDRIRYPSTDCGYDDYTLNLYKTEKNITTLPAPNDQQWMRWRADKLNQFMKKAYDSVKFHNKNVEFTNAPSHYASGNVYPAYNSFMQDWADWINNDYLDAAQVQMYVDIGSLGGYIESIFNYRVTDKTKQQKIYPGIAVKPNATFFSVDDVINMVKLVRSKGLKGQAFWYYSDLPQYFSSLKNSVFQEKFYPPYRMKGWRPEAVIVDEENQTKTSGWKKLPIPSSWNKSSLYATSIGNDSISYSAEIPYDGWYDVYAYQVVSYNRTSKAPFEVINNDGKKTIVLVDQSDLLKDGWFKLMEVYYTRGKKQIIKLTNSGIESDRWISADAVMLILNRKKSPEVITGIKDQGSIHNINEPILSPNYPNPFNPSTKIRYTIPSSGVVSLEIFDTLGRKVKRIFSAYQTAGSYEINCSLNDQSSGIYFCSLDFGGQRRTQKILLVR